MMMMNLTRLQVIEAHGLEVMVVVLEDLVGPEPIVKGPRLGPAKVSTHLYNKYIFAL